MSVGECAAREAALRASNAEFERKHAENMARYEVDAARDIGCAQVRLALEAGELLDLRKWAVEAILRHEHPFLSFQDAVLALEAYVLTGKFPK